RREGRRGDGGGRGVPRAARFRQPQLSGFPSADAALRLPALARNGDGARRPEAGMGAPKPLAGLPDAARRRAAGVPFDDAVVTEARARTGTAQTPGSLSVSTRRCCRLLPLLISLPAARQPDLLGAEHISQSLARRARRERFLLARVGRPAGQPDDLERRPDAAIAVGETLGVDLRHARQCRAPERAPAAFEQRIG